MVGRTAQFLDRKDGGAAMSYTAPVRASLDVTYACDLRCIHCRTNTGEIPTHIRKKMMTIDQIQEVIRELDEMNTFEITLTGGEPTMRKGFWDIIAGNRSLSNSTLTVITNAAYPTDEFAERIVDAGISSLRVSVDGTRQAFQDVRLKDSFELVMRRCAFFQEHIQSFKILTTVMRTNYHNIFELVSDLKQRGVRRQDLILVRAHGRGARNNLLLSEDQVTELAGRVADFKHATPAEIYDLNLNAPYLDPSEKFGLTQDVVMYPYMVPNTSIAISATGDVTMSRLYSSEPLGNVKYDSVRSIWEQGQHALQEEQQKHTPEELREIFWEFGAADGTSKPIPLTALLDRQIFEGAEVK